MLPEDIYNVFEITQSYNILNIKNIFDEITPYIFGTQREEPRKGNYYNTIPSNKTLFNSLNDGQYMYSFAIFPTFLQPTGHCNFAQIRDATMKFKLNQNIVNAFTNYSQLHGEIKMWSCTMNILRLISGMCGLAWMDTYQI